MNKLNTGFSGFSDDELYHLALTVINNLGTIPAFDPLLAQGPAITTAAGILQTAMELPGGPVREASIAAARGTLIPLLTKLANAMMATAGVTDTDFAASGFPLRQTPTHTSQPPDAPTNLRLRTTGVSGELAVLMNKTDRAVMYELEWTLDPVNGPWQDGGAYTSTRGIKLTDLTRGKDYYVRARAMATGQNRGPWSDLASAMVI